MESEKVKEIKNALDFNANDDFYYLPYIDDKDKQKTVKFADILTLINELESENERLNKALVDNLEAYKDGFNEGAGLKKGVDDKLKTENQQLKDRISELENQMCRNEYLHTATEKLNDIIILKQFAERLKEELLYGYFSCYSEVETYIDDTLEEFIKKGDDN